MPLPFADDHTYRPVAPCGKRDLIFISTGIEIFLTDRDMNIVRIAARDHLAACRPLEPWDRFLNRLLGLARRQGAVKDMRAFLKNRVTHL